MLKRMILPGKRKGILVKEKEKGKGWMIMMVPFDRVSSWPSFPFIVINHVSRRSPTSKAHHSASHMGHQRDEDMILGSIRTDRLDHGGLGFHLTLSDIPDIPARIRRSGISRMENQCTTSTEGTHHMVRDSSSV